MRAHLLLLTALLLTACTSLTPSPTPTATPLPRATPTPTLTPTPIPTLPPQQVGGLEGAKGRDPYDLLWYLSDPDWPPPNLTLLNNALRQSGWDGPELTPENWRILLRDRLQRLDWGRVVEDVRPLLGSSANLALLTLENVLRVLEKTGGEP